MNNYLILTFFAISSFINLSNANMYDLLFPDYITPPDCQFGCADWNNLKTEGSLIEQNTSDSLWNDKSLINQAQNKCAWPAHSSIGTWYQQRELPGYAGPFCWCKNTENGFYPKWGYCLPPPHYPTQINLQISDPNSLVIGFVTFCSLDGINNKCSNNTTKPIVEYKLLGGNNIYSNVGVTHHYTTPPYDGNISQPIRNYNMHFIKLNNLKSNTKYLYRVNNGYPNGIWSQFYEMKTINQQNTTKFAIFGDMGVFQWNNMENLRKRFANKSIDFVVQMGDHAYNIGQMDEHRGDNYMNAYSEVLKHMPWMPVIGNHEYYDNEYFHRYLNQTFGVSYNKMSNNKMSNNKMYNSYIWDNKESNRSTATSALGYLQSLGLSYGLSDQGNIPSGTSRYYSVNVGLVHIIAIDTNVYYFDTESIYRKAQLDWLEKDLQTANNNRDKVPWILLTSHYPLYCTGCSNNFVSSKYYASNIDEYLGIPPSKSSNNYDHYQEKVNKFGPLLDFDQKCLVNDNNNLTLKNSNYISVKDIEPLMLKYNADLYMAGHMHYYESLYPSKNFKLIQTNFTNPQAPVHITSGNGGPPSKDYFDRNCPGVNCSRIFSTRKQTNEYSYGRIEIFNHTHLLFEQIFNSNDTVFDSIFIIKDY